MEAFHQNFQIEAAGVTHIETRLKEYFLKYDFTPIATGNDELQFVTKFSWFQGWQFNPLHWQSRVVIHISKDQSLSIDYTVEGNGYLTPLGFIALFKGFIENLKRYLLGNEDFKTENQKLITAAKSRVLKAVLYILATIAVSTMLAMVMDSLTDFNLKYFGYLGLYAGAMIGYKWINKWLVSSSITQTIREI